MAGSLEMTTFGGGCLCVAVYQELQGVQSVVSGYAGGAVENPPTTRCAMAPTGTRSRADYVDPKIIAFEDIPHVWRTHDPTTLNRQGYDVGTVSFDNFVPQRAARAIAENQA
jgi:peptide-methionine (S)-S-oxide reductase